MALLDEARRALAALAPPGSRVLVATSGGPDSQALLDLCGRLSAELGWVAVFALGVDHGLRSAAALELKLAQELAASHGIPFASVTVQVEKRDNLLAAARRARYRALAQHARAVGADRIAVAHTATDQVETILLHLTRGAALQGVAGMRSRRGRLIRPLLQVSRSDLAAYVRERGLACAHDPSNIDPRRARVRLRNEVLPVLRQLNPEMEAAVARFAEQAQQDEALLRGAAERELATRLGVLDSLALAGIAALPQPVLVRVLGAWLSHLALPYNRRVLTQLMSAVHLERAVVSLGRRPLRVEAGRLWPPPGPGYTVEVPVPGHTNLPGIGLELASALLPRAQVNVDGIRLRGDRVAFDAKRLHSDLEVRSWRPGDRFRPFGLEGSIKVSDLFTNHKVPRALRAGWPLLCCGDDVLWVVGLRRSDVAPVNTMTEQVLTIEAGGAPVAHPW